MRCQGGVTCETGGPGTVLGSGLALGGGGVSTEATGVRQGGGIRAETGGQTYEDGIANAITDCEQYGVQCSVVRSATVMPQVTAGESTRWAGIVSMSGIVAASQAPGF